MIVTGRFRYASTVEPRCLEHVANHDANLEVADEVVIATCNFREGVRQTVVEMSTETEVIVGKADFGTDTNVEWAHAVGIIVVELDRL